MREPASILARIRLYEAPDEAADLFAQVVDEAEGDRETLAVAHEGVAACSLWMFERLDEVLRHSEVALALALEIGDEALAADVLIAGFRRRRCWAEPPRRRRPSRAAALQDSAADRRILDQPLVAIAEYWKWVDSHERARAALVDLMRHADELGDESALPWLLFLLGDVERLLGNLETALDCARTGKEAAEQAGQPLFARHNLALEGLFWHSLVVPTRRGSSPPRRSNGCRKLHVARRRGGARSPRARLGDAGEAVAQLEPILAFVRREAIAEPGAAGSPSI